MIEGNIAALKKMKNIAEIKVNAALAEVENLQEKHK